jgi:hypothetical protein
MQMNALLKKDVKPISIALAKGRKAVRSRGSYKLSDKFFSSSRAEMGRLFSNRLELFVTFWFKPKSKAKPITYPNIGIQVANCPNNRISENSIDGQFNTAHKVIGYYNGLNFGNTTHCNVAADCGTGIYYSGQNPLSMLLGNDMQDCVKGIILNNGYIGNQGSNTFSHYNKWSGGSSGTISNIGMLGSSYGQNNKFYVPQGVYPYDPALLTGGANKIGSTTIANTDGCPELLNDFGDGDWIGKANGIVNGENNLEGEYASSSKQIGQWQLYQFLTDTNNTLDNTWAAIQNQMLQNDGVQNFVNTFAITPLGQLTEVNNLIATESYETATDVNNAISTETELENMQRQFNDLLLQYYTNPEVGTEQNYMNQVLDYANLCPLAYGALVYQAQALYDLYDVNYQWADEINCQMAGESRRLNRNHNIILSPINNNILSQIGMYPNPALDKTTIYFNCKTTVQNFEVAVFNALGQQVYYANNASNCTNGAINLETKLLKGGIYLVEVKADKQLAYQAKLLVVK